MSEEVLIGPEAEANQHLELLNNVGVLLSDEKRVEMYNHMIPICDGDRVRAKRVTAEIAKDQEGENLAVALDSAQLNPSDLYDSTGALTVAGRIARRYVDSSIELGSFFSDSTAEDTQTLLGEQPQLKTLLLSLTANRVNDEGQAESMATYEDTHRELQNAYNLVAEVANGYGTQSGPIEVGFEGEVTQLTTQISEETEQRVVEQDKYKPNSPPNEVGERDKAEARQAEVKHTREATDYAVEKAYTDEKVRLRGGRGLRGRFGRAKAKFGRDPAADFTYSNVTGNQVGQAAAQLGHEAGQAAQAMGEVGAEMHQESETAKLKEDLSRDNELSVR